MKAPTAIRFPGGESTTPICRRVDAGIAALMAQHDGGLIVVVTHGGVVRAVLHQRPQLQRADLPDRRRALGDDARLGGRRAARPCGQPAGVTRSHWSRRENGR